LLGNSCEVNPPFLKELAEAADEKFAKFEPGYKRTFWEGFHHGFAVHGDLVCFHVSVLDYIDIKSTPLRIDQPGCDTFQRRLI
jgi:hypothetical protein